MFNKSKFKVFKTGPNTEEMYYETEYDEDEYGSSRSWQKECWRKFQSDLYFLEEHYNHAQTMYSNFMLRYYPIAPSGKYNHRYGELYKKTLRNLDCVGEYDGSDFNFEIPYLYTSVHELNPLDVFEFEKDHTYRDGVFKSNPIITIPANVPLVLEKFDDLRSMIGEWLIASEMESGKIHNLHGNLTVNKIGKIILKRELKKL
jgi:hypothetical protein